MPALPINSSFLGRLGRGLAGLGGARHTREQEASSVDAISWLTPATNPYAMAPTDDVLGVGMVQFVSWCELRSQSADVWRSLAQEKDLVVTSNGQPVAILATASAATLEATLSALRQSRAQSAVAAMQQRARDTGANRLTAVEVNAEISAARRGRSK